MLKLMINSQHKCIVFVFYSYEGCKVRYILENFLRSMFRGLLSWNINFLHNSWNIKVDCAKFFLRQKFSATVNLLFSWQIIKNNIITLEHKYKHIRTKSTCRTWRNLQIYSLFEGSDRLCKVVELSMQFCGKLLSDSFEKY